MGTVRKTSSSAGRIFILHGWTKKFDQWKPFVDYLESGDFSVNLLKIPGLTGKIDKPWTLGDYVLWLKHILSKQKGKLILIGHSNGGRIALAFAAAHQEKLKNLILIAPAGIRHTNPPITAKRLAFKIIAKIGKKITSSDKLRNALYKLARETDYKDSDKVMQKTMLNLISVDLRPILSKISVPTTIIWGEHDKTAPPSDGKLIHAKIKNSKLFIIKDARHSPQYTYPEIVADTILGELT